MRTREATAEMTNGERHGTVVVEADTAESAMERLVDELGDDVRILEARKIRRGGVGGFFSRELVQLTAEVTQPAAAAAEPSFGEVLAARSGAVATAPPSIEITDLRGSDTAVAVDDIAAKTLAASQITFAPQPDPVMDPPISIDLRVRPAMDEADIEIFEPDPEPQSTAELVFERASATRSEVVGSPGTVGGLPRAPHDDGRGSIDWGTTSLVRLGLPTPLINALSGVDRTDDLACLQTLAHAIAPLCGPLATDDTVVIGPATWGVAMLMDIEVVAAGDPAGDRSCIAVDSNGSAADRAWLDTSFEDRDTHLVIGADDAWRELLFRSPRFVSWTHRDSVIDALYVAATLDATLAYGVTSEGGELLPARPLEVAIAVRDLMGRVW